MADPTFEWSIERCLHCASTCFYISHVSLLSNLAIFFLQVIFLGPVNLRIQCQAAFTGSSATGSKPASMELGGKSPILIFEDTDLDKAADWNIFGCFWTNCQIYSTTSRLLVHINGKQFGVAPSQDSDTLFVGNICKTWTKEALKEIQSTPDTLYIYIYI